MLAIHRIQVLIWFSCAVLLRRNHGFTPIPRPANIRRARPLLTQSFYPPRQTTDNNRGYKNTRIFADSLNGDTPQVPSQQRFAPLQLLGGAVAGLSTTYLLKARTTSQGTAMSAPTVSVPVHQWKMLLIAAAIVLLQAFGLQTAQLCATVARHGMSWYLSQLHAFPLITKSLTSGVIGVIGDYFAQWLEYRLGRRRANNATNKNVLSIHGTYHVRRGFAVLADGIVISGPIMHWGFDLFERIVPNAQGNSLAAMIHVVADSLVLDSIFVGTAIIGTGLLEGYKFCKDIVPQLQRDYADTLKAGWATSATLMPLEFVCFRFFPVTLRTVAMNLTDVIWDGIVSFMAHRSRQQKEVVVPSIT